ncbi:TPA: DNA polymerase III subunit beta [Candidatus Dependentiae bacterium]|nr:MAG: polymerase III subunit beta protein [candidate division TM6 bacterium GW2011_GWE2_31_21]KKP53603.1 MAG: polymerase III subunit beta protein [candidate division TM6 bacterium GW2011_GWF2_33_332]HBS48157.1 DNA polymerase III subunit beta [Candidatus Dependentiae bacterium]HBZ73581.1 DNA polymerase III subunit beta [Candidatus Dependentiae bacterium]
MLKMENKFKVEQKDLFALLASMQTICSKKTTLDVTEFILFNVSSKELMLKATDLEISLRATMELDENFIDQASFLVSGKRIFELVREMEGEIEFTISPTNIRLKSRSVDLSLNIRDAADFPPFPERIENLMEMESSFLLNLLAKVSFLIPQNHSNTALNGMLLEVDENGMAMVATDGHCLAKVETKKYSLHENKRWLLPKRATSELKKILESTDLKNVFLGVCGSQLVFSGPNFNFFSKLLNDTFPEYKPVLSKEGFSPAVLIKDDIMKSLKLANCLLAGHFLSTKFLFQPGKLDLSLQNKEVGTLEESIKMDSFEGESVESRFYSPYLLNGLSVFPDKDLSFFIKNSNKPIIFESKQSEYEFAFLVMPVSATQQN